MTLKVIDEFKSEQILAKDLPVVKSYSYTILQFKSAEYIWKNTIFIKIISDKAVHKVKSNAIFQVNNKNMFNKQKLLVLKRAKALKAKRIIIQEKIYGKEFIVGIKNDEKFGELLMIGIGGRLAEQLKDVSFRVLPIEKKDFQNMLNDLKNQAMLSNLNKDKFWVFIQKLIKFTQKHKVEFIDLNPVIIDSDSKQPIIVDARIYIK
jgi:succinyl-CoA synthetase beta subunit